MALGTSRFQSPHDPPEHSHSRNPAVRRPVHDGGDRQHGGHTTTSLAVVDFDGYIAKAAKAAKASKKAYGVPRAVTIAQSILESGWGRSQLTAEVQQLLRHQMQCAGQPTPEGLCGDAHV